MEGQVGQVHEEIHRVRHGDLSAERLTAFLFTTHDLMLLFPVGINVLLLL